MVRNKLDISKTALSSFSLLELVKKAEELNRENQKTYTTVFPKDSKRLLSHYCFKPRPIRFTSEGEVEGGLSSLLDSLFDFSFTRSIFASLYSKEGGHCFDPASLFCLELASKVDGYPDYASFCKDLRQEEKGRSYRLFAGIEDSIPGEDDLCHFRYRVGSVPIDSTMDVFVRFLMEFGLIRPELLSTDGQLEPSNSRYRGCAHFCSECEGFPLSEAHRKALSDQIRAGAKRLQITCPFPEAVEKVRKATEKKGKSIEPKVALLEIEHPAEGSPQTPAGQYLAKLLSLDPTQTPPFRIKWSHLKEGPAGELLGRCSKVPSDLEARVGYHMDTQDPQKKERVFGYLQQRTTTINVNLGLELPVVHSTYPANADEGNEFFSHRTKATIPFIDGQVHCLDSGYDQRENYLKLAQNGVIPLIDYNRRREDHSPEALLKRGYDVFGTPYAPCGRLCRSNGYDYQSESRQYVCGLSCPEDERKSCPHAEKVMGYSHRMSFAEYPRLIGPLQRGTERWRFFYGTRTASERTNSYDQEVIEKGRKSKLRGLRAFSFSGAIRTLAQLLSRALNFILNATYTLGRLTALRI
jgi:hypothetical protein